MHIDRNGYRYSHTKICQRTFQKRGTFFFANGEIESRSRGNMVEVAEPAFFDCSVTIVMPRTINSASTAWARYCRFRCIRATCRRMSADRRSLVCDSFIWKYTMLTKHTKVK